MHFLREKIHSFHLILNSCIQRDYSSPSYRIFTFHSALILHDSPFRHILDRLQSMGLLRVGHDWATDLIWSLIWWRPMEKALATHSSTLAWKIPWMEGPGGLQFMGSLESDTTERLHLHFSLSCIGEGNGNPLQCSCLENPRDGGAWWAAVYGVAQSRTQLKWLSSSSSRDRIVSPSDRLGAP